MIIHWYIHKWYHWSTLRTVSVSVPQIFSNNVPHGFRPLVSQGRRRRWPALRWRPSVQRSLPVRWPPRFRTTRTPSGRTSNTTTWQPWQPWLDWILGKPSPETMVFTIKKNGVSWKTMGFTIKFWGFLKNNGFFYHSIWGFPEYFPLSQSIEWWDKTAMTIKLSTMPMRSGSTCTQ